MSDILFHAIDPRDQVFCHNVVIQSGRITAVSFARELDATLRGIITPYEAFTRERDKESMFEAIRASEYSNAPPRMGTIFLFESAHQAEVANTRWWSGQRTILPAEVVTAKRRGTFDAALLDVRPDAWAVAARRYWSGERTATPQLEVLVDGVVQLKNWEPLGKLLVSGRQK